MSHPPPAKREKETLGDAGGGSYSDRVRKLDEQRPGLTAPEAAAIIGCSPSTVDSARRRRPGPPGPRPKPDSEVRVRFPKPMGRRVLRYAREIGVTRSEAIVRLVKRGLEHLLRDE